MRLYGIEIERGALSPHVGCLFRNPYYPRDFLLLRFRWNFGEAPPKARPCEEPNFVYQPCGNYQSMEDMQRPPNLNKFDFRMSSKFTNNTAGGGGGWFLCHLVLRALINCTPPLTWAPPNIAHEICAYWICVPGRSWGPLLSR